MNKTQLINSLSEQTGLSKIKSKEVLDTLTSTITNTLADGEKVTLVGFGTFTTTERPARKAMNPKTGEVVDVPTKRVAKFKAGAALSKTVRD
jgi:DNA-binding protein HU-beta